MTSLTNLIGVERSRIDNLLTGETLDNNSELIDIRTGYDGTIHESAGTSVRSQVDEIKGDLSTIDERLTDYNDVLLGAKYRVNYANPDEFICGKYRADGEIDSVDVYHTTGKIKILDKHIYAYQKKKNR